MACMFCPYEGVITDKITKHTWSTIVEEAKAMKDNDPFMANIVDQTILR